MAKERSERDSRATENPLDEPLVEEEEIPRTVMIAMVLVVIAIAALYLIYGGGHNHLH